MRIKFTAVFAVLLTVLLGSSVPCLAQSQAFSDVPGHWAAGSIETVSQQGVMQGVGHGLFNPNVQITRAQMAVSLFRAFKLDYGDKRFFKAPEASDYYDDVPNDEWYAAAVTFCAVNEIFPVEGRNFRPNDAVTRVEAAQAVAHSFAAKKIPVVTIQMWPMFDDTESLANSAQVDIAFMSNAGIMKGSANHFRPLDEVSRAEAAAILARSLDVIARCSEPAAQ
jgi:hypothetical protein